MSEFPENIGKYTISGIAGKGAMGVVYVGHDPFVDRKVAIKISTQGFDDEDQQANEQARKMFFNEAKAAGALDHPNLLKIYDAGDADGQPYIVMEYVSNADTLRSFCKEENQLPIRTIVGYIRQCALAIDYAHKAGVTHRDIKPANIMLTDDGVIKICDFGIAQRTKADQTQLMGWFGSPLYMSPEQAADENITHASDLFSLGVVAYELLTSKQPFAAKGISGLIHNVINKDPTPAPEIRPEISEALWRVIKKCLAKKTTDRYKSGMQIATDLAAVLSDLENPLLELSEDERFAMLQSLAFFADFNEPEIREVMKIAAWEAVTAGTVIITEGDPGDELYVVLTGDVSVQRAGKEIAALGTGECFGEMGYLAQARRSANVIANGNVSLLKIAKPIKEWASLPVQMRLNRLFQQTLIDRLAQTSRQLSKSL